MATKRPNNALATDQVGALKNVAGRAGAYLFFRQLGWVSPNFFTL